ncbi:MAG: hypothetical protein K2X86_06205 [Cytophagaceae bacterium]|nr:hypothetical protein [Cytophagaceae bacterium]
MISQKNINSKHMWGKNSSRRKFLKFFGLSAGMTVAGTTAFAGLIDSSEHIRKLNPQQKEFMIRYEKWMDEFIEAIHLKKKEPGNAENQKKIMKLSEQASEWKPQLSEYMKDPEFIAVYQVCIQRMKKEI